MCCPRRVQDRPLSGCAIRAGLARQPMPALQSCSPHHPTVYLVHNTASAPTQHDILMPGITKCRECHGRAATPASSAPNAHVSPVSPPEPGPLWTRNSRRPAAAHEKWRRRSCWPDLRSPPRCNRLLWRADPDPAVRPTARQPSANPREGPPERLQAADCDPTRLPTLRLPSSGLHTCRSLANHRLAGHPTTALDPYNTTNVLKGTAPSWARTACRLTATPPPCLNPGAGTSSFSTARPPASMPCV